MRGYALTLLVADESGWENLCWLITQAQHQAPKGEGLLHFAQLQGRTAGLIALSGGREGEVARASWKAERHATRLCEAARRYAALFDPGLLLGSSCIITACPYDEQRIAALVRSWRRR